MTKYDKEAFLDRFVMHLIFGALRTQIASIPSFQLTIFSLSTLYKVRETLGVHFTLKALPLTCHSHRIYNFDKLREKKLIAL